MSTKSTATAARATPAMRTPLMPRVLIQASRSRVKGGGTWSPVDRKKFCDASGGEVGALRAASPQRDDEAPLAGTEWAAGEAGDVELSRDRRAARKTEALELTALDLLRHGVAREEGDTQAFPRRPLDRFARVELPDALGGDAGLRQLAIGDLARARVRSADEE